MRKEIPPVLWTPSPSFRENSRLAHYMNWLQEHKGLTFKDYASIWKWSTENLEAFWGSLWEYFSVKSYSPYSQVLKGDEMPGYEWFTGSTLNYAEHIFRARNDAHPAIIFQSERQSLIEISWEELAQQVASMRAHLQSVGVKKGDRVVAFLPNIPEATYAFLATCSLGAIWSSCSPDFGASSVLDRFRQIEPKVLITVDGYQYGGKTFEKMEVVKELVTELPTLQHVILLPYLNPDCAVRDIPKAVSWQDTFRADAPELSFEPVPFSHPIWVLYSSGTTGIPKAITHSQGGVLMEHLKYLAFHNDVHPGERFFWFSTTGWMMWNFVQASFLAGATIVLYDGNPGYPNLNVLWKFSEKAGIHHFGTSAPFLIACMRQGLNPGKDNDLSVLRSIGSTGSPLPPDAFKWVYEAVKKDLWLCSMAGGTDVCTAFVGGCPLEPVVEGEIQCLGLGCALEAWDEAGDKLVDEVGEMVITRPMPSMPVFFWNDPKGERYRSSYFEDYKGVWRHGDWVVVTSRGSLVMLGRSDATLNRHGVRIGTAEIYRVIDTFPEIKDSLIVNIEQPNGDHFMPLFVVMNEGHELNEDLVKRLSKELRAQCSPRHVPDKVIPAPDIPYTISGKKMETPVKKILMGIPVEKAANVDSMRNPEALVFFVIGDW
ncbi:MAG: acetoacetate--CoA ligase [Lewinellaceae bacterium]|nr:acetoacetate--CoA ligase [Lewinellaceae bacterium]